MEKESVAIVLFFSNFSNFISTERSELAKLSNDQRETKWTAQKRLNTSFFWSIWIFPRTIFPQKKKHRAVLISLQAIFCRKFEWMGFFL